MVRAAEGMGIITVVENIEDVRPETRRMMVERFGSNAIALSIDAGHAQLARRASCAPPIADFVFDARDLLAHVHLHDMDGHADRHWPPGDGAIEWVAVFRALCECNGDPPLALEPRDKTDVQRGFGTLKKLGVAILPM